MVNWTKRVEKAAAGILEPGEQILAGVNLTKQQFTVSGGVTGGAIAGGLVGALVGGVWDRRQASKQEQDEAVRERAAIEDLPVRDVSFPIAGAVAGVTDRRLLLFRSSQMGSPKDVFYEVSLAEIDSVYDREVEKKLLRGAPASRAILIVFKDQSAVPLWGITAKPNGKWLDAFVVALRQAVTAVG